LRFLDVQGQRHARLPTLLRVGAAVEDDVSVKALAEYLGHNDPGRQAAADGAGATDVRPVEG
jgi:hypothetical protein